MHYTVIWSEPALDALMDIWVSSSDRRSVTEAVEEIDRQLGVDPDQRGEEYYGDRLLIVGSLFVTYKIEEDDRVAEVVAIWQR